MRDTLFVEDPVSPLFNSASLEPHESARPPAWGLLTSRLQAWLEQGCPALHAPDAAKPANLHISHSWGGGVAQWIDNFIAADDNGGHFQLLAEGPQTGQGFGQRLSLYCGNELSVPIASWWLQPPIRSIEASNAQYTSILNFICRRYGIDRIIVSSLVGHCIAALRTGLPTVQVLHDHFPLWPLLSQSPLPFLRDDGADLEAALARPGVRNEFGDLSAGQWRAIQNDYSDAIQYGNVKLAAPGSAVANLQKQLDPRWQEIEIEVIPHGLRNCVLSFRDACSPARARSCC